LASSRKLGADVAIIAVELRWLAASPATFTRDVALPARLSEAASRAVCLPDEVESRAVPPGEVESCAALPFGEVESCAAEPVGEVESCVATLGEVESRAVAPVDDSVVALGSSLPRVITTAAPPTSATSKPPTTSGARDRRGLAAVGAVDTIWPAAPPRVVDAG
jgi:hypothetical protein